MTKSKRTGQDSRAPSDDDESEESDTNNNSDTNRKNSEAVPVVPIPANA
jgi:hypothetical protein